MKLRTEVLDDVFVVTEGLSAGDIVYRSYPGETK
jgi:hypothetical protein